MKSEIDYKVNGGKLLRLEFELESGAINWIKITGDFFVHPENKITLLEESLAGCKISDIEDVLDECIQENRITLVGFNSKDIYKAVLKAVKT